MHDIDQLKFEILKNISRQISVEITTMNEYIYEYISITIDYNTTPTDNYLLVKEDMNKYGYDYLDLEEKSTIYRSGICPNNEFYTGPQYCVSEYPFGANILSNIENALVNTNFKEIQINFIQQNKKINFLIVIVDKLSFIKKWYHGYSHTFKYLTGEEI